MRDVEAKDDLQGHMHLNLHVGEEGLAPCLQSDTSFFEFVMQDMVRLDMVVSFIPRILDSCQEAWHLDPEIFKAEAFRALQPVRICKQKRAVVREGG